MGVRIRREWHTDKNVLYRINIWDSDYTSTILTNFEINGFEIEYDTSNELTEPLQASTCNLELYLDYSSNANSFITDLATAQEDEFKLYIEKFVNGAYQIYWAGIIQSDILSWENDNPRLVKIIAKDGISRLANIYFNPAIDYTAKQSVQKIIFDCLSFAGTAQFWNGSSVPYIATSGTWYDTQQNLSRIERGPSTWFIDKRMLFDNERGDKNNQRSSTDPPMKTLEILKTLLIMFGLRMKLSNGTWHIQQISRTSQTYIQANYNYQNNYIGVRQVETLSITANITSGGNAKVVVTAVNNPSSPITLSPKVNLGDNSVDVAIAVESELNTNGQVTDFFFISRASNQITFTAKLDVANDTTMNILIEDDSCIGITTSNSANTTSGVSGISNVTYVISENSSDPAVEAGGNFEHYPPLKLATADIYPSDILNVPYSIKSYVNKDNLTYTGSVINIGTIYGGSKTYLNFNIYYDVLTWHAILSTFPKIKVTLTLICGSYRIKNLDGRAIWTTVSTDKYIEYIDFSAVIDGKQNIFPIESDEIPFAKETSCTIKVELELQRSSVSVNYPSLSELNTYFKEIQVLLLDYTTTNPKTGQITGYELENPLSSVNSINRDFGLFKIHDTGSIASSNVIEIIDNEWLSFTPSNASKSGIWETYHVSQDPLIYSVLREALSLQKTAIKKYNGKFRATGYQAHLAIGYDSTIWIFQGGRYIAKLDCWDGEWFGIAYDPTGVPQSTTRINAIPSQIPFFRWPNFGKPVTKVKNDLPQTGTTNTKNTGGVSIIVLDTDALPTESILKGDKLMLVNPANTGLIGEVTVSSTPLQGDTSVSINSFTPDIDIWPGVELKHNPQDVIASREIRASNFARIGKANNYQFTQILYVSTTNATVTEATTNGLTASGITNRILVPDNSAMGCEFIIIGKQDSSANCLYYTRRALFKNNGGTTALEGSVQTIGTDIVSTPINACSVTISANNTNDCLKVEVTGIALTIIDWTIVCKCSISM